MSWRTLLDGKKVAVEPSSKKELDELRAMVAINLKDAKVTGISAQGRYEFAYNAARLMATIVVRASGYRVIARNGHHYFTFQALAASDSSFAVMAVYFDRARDQRNDFMYDAPTAISDTDAEELVKEVAQFVIECENWISKHYPALRK